MKKSNDMKGYSLIELVVSFAILTIVFITLGLAIAHQVRTYQEVRLTNELQQEVFDLLEVMRVGYPVDNLSEDKGLIGLATAHKVEIGFDRKSLTIKPRITNPGLNVDYYIEYHHTTDGEIKCSGRYGLFSFPERTVFPNPDFSSNRKMSSKNQ
ncbi:MAG: prepilin-type N-terminal cleavage/methylation domain-containing protein, partial [Candidatus Cloacimonadota bacterium]|nr:prepilin-type N-terminal cleavage/methylation domain-containing protein [Candidatus Cloacimonadota bacterium]